MPPSPTTFARLRRGLAHGLSLTLVVLAAACGGGSDSPTGPGGGPGGDTGDNGGGTPAAGDRLPAELAGTWYNGNVSSLNFHDDAGHWDNAGGTGLFYTFKADGTFEYGWREYSNLGGCAISAMIYKKGTLEFDAADATIVLHPTEADMHSEDSCHADGNYDKELPRDGETLIYEFGQDEVGNQVLWLRWPSTEASGFYRQ